MMQSTSRCHLTNLISILFNCSTQSDKIMMHTDFSFNDQAQSAAGSNLLKPSANLDSLLYQ